MSTSDASGVGRGIRGPARATLGLLLIGAMAACDGGPPADAGAAGREGAAAAAPSPEGGASSADAAADTQRVNVTDLGVNTGDPSAPIQVVEFSDFGCPHCRAFHEETYPAIREEYVETGKVIWKYVPFVLGTFPNSLAATRAGHCAIAQDEFAPVRDLLFEQQREWMTTRDPTDLFVGYAREAGLDAERFRSCIEEGRREEEIRQALDVGRRIGIKGTPTFFIQGRTVQGNRPVAFFREAFDRMLEEAGAEGGAGGGS